MPEGFVRKWRRTAARTVKLPSHETPKWLQTDAGREYVDAIVPKPWAKPAIEGQRVKLYDKIIGFAANESRVRRWMDLASCSLDRPRSS